VHDRPERIRDRRRLALHEGRPRRRPATASIALRNGPSRSMS
jgi:hypothetical protein